ncbi:RagB/SusD family nutrient uptake outer membrane protein [Pedobacter sp.]|uniref:RagB/SusD family nutrient uptake outer membrane protein n=1 Tax=Pedobacter sp. TaxID=1411316 RepID=UPI003BACF834
MNKNLNYYLLVLLALTFTSCKKWLDVKPEDKFIENQLYSTPQGFADANNGFYINNGDNKLYGATLSCTTMDILAQLYLVSSGNASHYQMSTYGYSQDRPKATIDGIWTNLYLSIANANKFLESLDTYESVLDVKTRNLYRGETLGLRAMYYFDLMRMFTKSYSADSLSEVLPYYDKITYEFSEYKPSNYVMQKVLQDLKNAEELLQGSDPAMTQSRISRLSNTYGRDTRNYKMNYYAVKALQARVNMWKGDKAAALKAAKVLIENQSKFPWTTLSDLTLGIGNKIFGTEMIYGVENTKLNDLHTSSFSAALFDSDILAPNTSGTFINATVFEGYATDYRNQYIWKVNGRPYPTFFKYQDVGNTSFNTNRTVPLIRMGEMYLIAAECEPDNTLAVDYLNTLRLKRNIPALPTGTTGQALTTAIMKEYRKEFYGEGQLFFYYKRTQTSSIISAGTNAAMTITAANFTFPVPLSETTPR